MTFWILAILPFVLAIALAVLPLWGVTARSRRARYVRAASLMLGTLACVTIGWQQLEGASDRRAAAERERELFNNVSYLKGQMATLTQLVPSLVQGDPEKVVAAMRTAADINARIQQLETANQGRRLNAEQAIALAASLRQLGTKTIKITNWPLDPEGRTFADDIAETFRRAGWKVVQSDDVMAGPPRGVILYFREGGPREVADQVALALSKVGVTVEVTGGGNVDEDTVDLFVSGRP